MSAVDYEQALQELEAELTSEDEQRLLEFISDVEVKEISLVDVPAVPRAVFGVEKQGKLMLLSGPVLVPDEVDQQNDRVSKAEIRRAAYRYLIESRRLSLLHKRALGEDEAVVVESHVAKNGNWVITVAVGDPDVQRAVADGKLRGFSIGGAGRRE